MSSEQPAQPSFSAQPPQPDAGQSPWKTPKSKFFWPMVAGAVLLWAIAAFITFSTLHASGDRRLTRVVLVGLGGALVYAVRRAEASLRSKEMSRQAMTPGGAWAAQYAPPPQAGTVAGQQPGWAAPAPGTAAGQQWPSPPTTAPGQHTGYGTVPAPGTAPEQTPIGYGQQPHVGQAPQAYDQGVAGYDGQGAAGYGQQPGQGLPPAYGQQG